MAEAISPDDRCGVCDEVRDRHGDKNHKFSIDGNLIPLPKGPTPTNTPPAERGAGVMPRDPVMALTLRMVERMIDRGVLQGDDLIYIFGGGYANHRGQAGEGTSKDQSTKSSE